MKIKLIDKVIDALTSDTILDFVLVWALVLIIFQVLRACL